MIQAKLPGKSKTRWLLALALGLGVAGVVSAAPTTNSFPFSDTFESYTNSTPLVDGTNGWYGSTNTIIVQTNFACTGTNAAMLPVDCTLSNRFVSAESTNVWFQMDVRAILYDGTNAVEVDTNKAAMFYLDSNGYFVVHNGPVSPDQTNSTNWVTVSTAAPIATNVPTWVRINIYMDFPQTNWDLYADGVLVTNNITFINTNLTNFMGFDVYNGSATTYCDNVSVEAPATTNQPLLVAPSALAQSFYAGATVPVIPLVQTVKVMNVWATDMGFEVSTNRSWIQASVANGTITSGTTQDVVLTYADVQGWAVGASNATVTVVATNGAESWGTQTVQVVLNMLSITNSLYVAPAQFSNSVWKGAMPTNRLFNVRNLGDVSFTYSVATDIFWIACSSNAGTLDAYGTNILTLSNTVNTLDWVAGTTSNATVTIVATNTANGVFAVTTVVVAVNVQAFSDAFALIPASFTNPVWIGDTPTQRTFVVSNMSDASFVYKVETNALWITASTTGGTLNARSTNSVNLTYRATWGWREGQSNATAIVSSAEGYGVTQNMAVILNVTTSAWNYYVRTNGTDTSLPYQYTNWETAALSLTGAVYKANFYTNIASVVWLSNGVYRLPSQVTISNITVRSVNGAANVTVTGGTFRGFYLVHTGAVLNDLTITNCKAGLGTNGGAVFAYTGKVWNCRLFGNSSTNGGGAAVGAGGVLSNCTIWGNTATNGGGVYLVVSGLVANCTITNNTAVKLGGGVHVATGLVWNCSLLKNTSTNGGGAAVGPRGIVRNCLIWGNTATNGGGVYYNTAGRTGLVESCTIASNYAVLDGGGLFTDTSVTGTCMNSVLYTNSVGAGLNTNWGTNANATLCFTNSSVGLPIEAFGANCLTNLDPLFVNVTTGDCRLTSASPGINTGTNQTWMTDQFDLIGKIRKRFGRVDMGAYEWHPYQGMGLKVNGVSYENIKLINGVEPLWINGVTNSSSVR